MAKSQIPTLLDVIRVVSECATNDQEALATVASLINSGKVRLCGDFAGATIDVSAVGDRVFGLRKRCSALRTACAAWACPPSLDYISCQ
jgi:hypothetical protein